MNKDVTLFLNELNLPLRKEIDHLRQEILRASPELVESIKWNGPNYIFKGEDRITMKIHPSKNIQLIFHRGAKVRDQPEGRLIKDDSGLLTWKANDRALITFNTIEDIVSHESVLIHIVKQWLKVTSQ